MAGKKPQITTGRVKKVTEGRFKKGWGWNDLAQDARESIILSRDLKNIPAGLVVDEKGIVDIDELSAEQYADVLEAQQKDPRLEELPEADETDIREEISGKSRAWNPFAILLHILRQPENYLIEKYYRSNLRQSLVKNFEWFSEFEGEQELHYKLQNVYGGSYNPLPNIAFFVRNNILATLIAVAVGGHFFVGYLSKPADNRYAAQSTSVSNPGQELSNLTPVSISRDFSKILNHCSVTAGLRQYFNDAEDYAVKSKAAIEITGFIRVYRNSEIEAWHTAQESKHDIVVSYIEAAMPKVSRYRDQTADQINEVTKQRRKILGELEAITNNRTQKLRDVNRSIILRTQLANLEAEIETGPSSVGLDKLDEQIDRLQDVAMGGDIAVSADMSRWAVNTAMQLETRFVESITDVINQDVYATVELGSKGTPEARLYRMQILVTTLRHFGDLIGHLATAGNYFENRVGERQQTSNQELTRLLGSKDRKLLDYDNCLTTLNGVKGKLTVN